MGAAATLLVLAWLITFLVHPWSDDSNMDVTHFPPRAQEWIDGKLPYRDVKFEYPPLAALAHLTPSSVMFPVCRSLAMAPPSSRPG